MYKHSMQFAKFCLPILLCLIPSLSFGVEIHFENIQTEDNSTIQICFRFPDPKEFPGKRPAIMIIPGSSRYDSCRALEKPYSDALSAKGIVVFARQKRGLSRNLKSGELEIDSIRYEQCDIPHLKIDTLAAFEALESNPLVNSLNIALFGGSEGTILSTYVGLRHPELAEINLISSMIEPFKNLFDRQFYVLLPQELISEYDKDLDKLISSSELTNQELQKYGLSTFSKIDKNHDGFLNSEELKNEILRVVEFSVRNRDSTFFLSDIGGQIPVSWYTSALRMKDLGPQVLKLKTSVHLYHGTLDTNTDIGPVRSLERQANELGRKNISFQYFDGLTHQLSPEVIADIYSKIGDRLVVRSVSY